MSGATLGRTMHPANTVTRADALARYRTNVQTWLSFKAQSTEFTPGELATIETAWQAGRRTDECAVTIQADRALGNLQAGWRRG